MLSSCPETSEVRTVLPRAQREPTRSIPPSSRQSSEPSRNLNFRPGAHYAGPPVRGIPPCQASFLGPASLPGEPQAPLEDSGWAIVGRPQSGAHPLVLKFRDGRGLKDVRPQHHPDGLHCKTRKCFVLRSLMESLPCLQDMSIDLVSTELCRSNLAQV